MSTTIRTTIHDVIKEHNRVIQLNEDMKFAFDEYLKNPTPEFKKVLDDGFTKVRDAMYKASSEIHEIRFIIYSFPNPDIPLSELYAQLRSKNKKVHIHLVYQKDDPQCEMTEKMLEYLGFTFSFSSNYSDAIAYVKKNLPQLLIADLYIPNEGGLNGKQFLQAVADAHVGINVIPISDMPDESLKKFNPARTLVKPVTISEIEAAITVAVAQIAG